MTSPPTLADLMADPSELDVSCLDCHQARASVRDGVLS
jgi:hypothetical protein